MTNRIIHLGPPGTGKTTTLLAHLEEELKAGVPVERIAFLTFTRRARREALERVEKVLGFSPKDLPHFRTIHSMAFRGLSLKDGDVMGRKELQTFGEAMGLTFLRSGVDELSAEGIGSQNKGDALLAIDNLARLRGQKVREAWGDARLEIPWPEVEHFVASYRKFKTDLGLMDFTDVLSEFARQKKTIDVEVALIDEAQDLSALQWYAALQAVSSASRQHIAGDDDQALFKWAGADVDFFIGLEGEKRVLSHSYRLPRAVHALSARILSRIRKRLPKEFSARDADGLIKRHASADSLKVLPGEQWLWLVRNRYLMNGLRALLERRAIIYSSHGFSSINEDHRDLIYAWERLRAGRAVPASQVKALYAKLRTKLQIAHGMKTLPGVADAQELTLAELKEWHGLHVDGPWYEILLHIPPEQRAYYRALLRTHGTLKLEPQVQLETIHGAKGAEAPHVALFLEQSRRVWKEAQEDGDAEHRVFYVGCTRARETLHLIEPTGAWGYRMPTLTG